MPWYDLNEKAFKNEDEEVKHLQQNSSAILRSESIKVKFLETQTSLISNVNDILTYPKNGEQYRIITQKSMNAFTFILKLVEDFGKIDECYLTSYGINQKTIYGLEYLIENKAFTKLNILLSDSMRKRSATIPRYEQMEVIVKRNSDFIKSAYVWNHTKILLAKINTHYYIVEGSGNLADNARIEQYMFEDNKMVYDFHKNWIDNILR